MPHMEGNTGGCWQKIIQSPIFQSPMFYQMLVSFNYKAMCGSLYALVPLLSSGYLYPWCLLIINSTEKQERPSMGLSDITQLTCEHMLIAYTELGAVVYSNLLLCALNWTFVAKPPKFIPPMMFS